MKACIVDIGSNSIRSMKAERAPGGFSFFDKEVFIARLAEGLLQTGRLSQRRMAQALDILRRIQAKASVDGCPIYAYATSAVRDAANSATFLAPAQDIIGRAVDVLSGDQEASFAYQGATNGSGGLIDIGGGSSQIIMPGYLSSFPFGCVRAKDAVCSQDDFDVLQAALMPALRECIPLPATPAAMPWTGIGGTATTLAAVSLNLCVYDPCRVSGHSLARTEIRNLLNGIAVMGSARAEHPLLRERHDIILQGGAILLYIMDGLSIGQLRISDADGLEGYAMYVLDGA